MSEWRTFARSVRRAFKPLLPYAAALIIATIAASATPPSAHAQVVAPPPAPVSGERLFRQQCAACHSMAPGETRVGPSLARLSGRRAGSLAGFGYSAALKRSELTWTQANLDKWLTSSAALVPNTTMSFSQADAAKRKAIVDYLIPSSTK